MPIANCSRKASPYWDRIPTIVPGQPGGYLEAATIYWDYFDFDNALRLLNDGRKKLADENLYSYEAGRSTKTSEIIRARSLNTLKGRWQGLRTPRQICG